jgi:hypothetical protein
MKLLVLVAALAAMSLPAGAQAKKPGHGGGGGGGFSTTSTYVKNYENVVGGVQRDLTPVDVQPTADGGWIALAITPSPTNGVGVAWLLKASSVGAPQWQEEVGCLSTPPGDYSDELSLRQTSDGGYVLAGGTIGCGSGNDCPSLSGLQCGLVEKLNATGGVVWARVYSAGADGTAIDAIAPTSDGGFVAVGSATDASHDTGALILKLDALGSIQWQRQLGPTGSNQGYLYAVQQTADGGYAAAGELDTGTNSSTGAPLISVLAVKLDAAGDVTWQHAFNDVGPNGVTATENVRSLVQTSDGGYAIAGGWDTSTIQGECCQGALLLKLTPSGTIQQQTAYSGGVRCANGACVTLGGDIYSLHQTADGGYLLAGDANLDLMDEAPIVPWLAKVDGSGALVWQEQDYQVNPATNRPLSEYFAASAQTAEGPLALGWTENLSNGLGELFGVQTDANGAVGTCSQVHAQPTLTSIDPGLAQFAPGLTVTTAVGSTSQAPVQTLATSASATAPQC